MINILIGQQDSVAWKNYNYTPLIVGYDNVTGLQVCEPLGIPKSENSREEAAVS